LNRPENTEEERTMKHPTGVAGSLSRGVTFSLLFLGGILAVSAQTLSFTQSDVNQDGVVEAADLALLAGHLAGAFSVAGFGDVNEDGVIDATDLAAMQSAVSGPPAILSLDPPEVLWYGPGGQIWVQVTPIQADQSYLQIDGNPVATYTYADWEDWPYLYAEIPADAINVVGYHGVVVVNPGLPETVSAEGYFYTVDGYATINGITPSEIYAGSTAVEISVSAGPIFSDSVVRANGSDLSTTYWFDGSSEWLTALLPDDLTATVGSVPITVVNFSSYWTAESAPSDIQVLDSTPSISGVSPSEIEVGSAGVEISVSAYPIFIDSIVRANGTDLPTTYSDDGFSQWLVATLWDDLTAILGYIDITVFNSSFSTESGPFSIQVVEPPPPPPEDARPGSN
jgi:hypothetical protein